jgi:hypothetical protein
MFTGIKTTVGYIQSADMSCENSIQIDMVDCIVDTD